MSNLVPIEFKNQRIMTTSTLAEQFGTESKNIQMNHANNKERFVEGKHYIKLEGEELKKFKESLPNEIGEPFKYTSQLVLWTDQGAARQAKILDTDEAWEVFEMLEDTYFRVREAQPQLQALSPQLQLLINMELEQKKLQLAITETKEEIQAIRDTVTISVNDNWREETNRLVSRICVSINDHKTPKQEIYKALENRAACDLKKRLNNMRGRIALDGATKTKINNLCNLDVIEEDKKLKEIYIQIVKEMAIKYKVA